MFVGSMTRRSDCKALAVVSVLLAVSGPLNAKPVLLEGFETPAQVRAVRGAEGTRVTLTGVKGTPYVTQGEQAAFLPPGTTVSVAVSAGKLAAASWLRVDTVTLQPLPHPVQVTFVGADFSVVVPAYVQAGSDTLALPLSVVRAEARAPWPPAGVVVSLKNAADTPLIVDNVHLAPPTPPPPNAMLMDYGPSRQVLWPGFARGGGESDPITWGKSEDSHPGAVAAWPDPLGRDFIGPRLGTKAIDHLILGSGTKSVSVWLWLTHYAIGMTQPVEYVAMFGRRSLARGQLTRREMLGPRGLLEGAGQPWTPEWFGQDYADQFVQVVQVTAGGTRRRLDLGNCQLAAAAMVPLAGRGDMVDYVKQVQSDLLRYRRQFVVGSMYHTRCSVAPMAVEERTGAMVFAPPEGRGFTAGWVPRPADRATSIKVAAAPGMDIVIPLAVVPLRPAKSFSISVPLLRSRTGKILAFEKPGLVAYCVQRVPRVDSAAVRFRPWVLVPPPRFRAEAGDVCMIVLKGRLRATARADRYTGTLGITRSGLRTDMPLAMEVLGFSVEGAADPIIGVRNSVQAGDYYHTLSALLSPAQQVLETAKARRTLLANGIDALTIPGVSVSSSKSSGGSTIISVSSLRCASHLRGFPADMTLRGRTLLNASAMAASFSKGAAQTLALANAAKVKQRYLLWYSRGAIAGTDKAAGIALATAEKGAAAMAVSGSTLLAVEDVAALSPWSALIVVPDVAGLGKGIAAARKGGVKHVYLHSSYPDRYTCGFYSCALGASGTYVYGASADLGGTYNGYWINGRGMLAVQGDGTLTPTVALMRMWQARSDFQLMRSCEILMTRHAKDAPGAAELAAVLKEIRDTANAADGPSFSTMLLRSTVVSPAKMEAWRTGLLTAAEKLLRG